MKRTHEASSLDEPPENFCEWWNPYKRDTESGADVGGHPDAERVWARKDPGRWVHRTYGTNARIAWNTQRYRSEWSRWREIGSPERDDCMMIAATYEVQKQFWSDIKGAVNQIGKNPPVPQPIDYDPPARGTKLEY